MRQQEMETKRRTANSTKKDQFREMSFSGKLDKYKLLIEKEFQLRCKLSKSCHFDERRRCVSFCDCGRQIYPPQQLCTPSYASPQLRSKSSFQNNRRLPQQRPLSADQIETMTATNLRKMMAEEKADKRRASIKSLEEDFVKVRLFMKKSHEISSTESLDESLPEEEVVASQHQQSTDINNMTSCIPEERFVPLNVEDDISSDRTTSSII